MKGPAACTDAFFELCLQLLGTPHLSRERSTLEDGGRTQLYQIVACRLALLDPESSSLSLMRNNEPVGQQEMVALDAEWARIQKEFFRGQAKTVWGKVVPQVFTWSDGIENVRKGIADSELLKDGSTLFFEYNGGLPGVVQAAAAGFALELLDSINEVRAEHDVEEVYLVGHSLGGAAVIFSLTGSLISTYLLLISTDLLTHPSTHPLTHSRTHALTHFRTYYTPNNLPMTYRTTYLNLPIIHRTTCTHCLMHTLMDASCY